VASIFRGLSTEQFESEARPIFHRLRERWNNVPFLVVNDGEVAALGASTALQDNAMLGISMGTSQAAGYVTPSGFITDWLNELAFAPIDYREGAPQGRMVGRRRRWRAVLFTAGDSAINADSGDRSARGHAFR
jgi:hypothetical protein